MQASALAPAMQQMGGYRAGLLGQAAQTDIGAQQRQQAYPWQQLNQYRGAVTGATPSIGMPGFGGQGQSAGNPVLGGLGTGLTAGAMGANPWAAAGLGVLDFLQRK